MDYTQQFKYCTFRIFLLFGADILGLMLGKGLYWIIASLLPSSAESLKQFLISDLTGSVTAALIMVCLLAAVFRDDAKRHAAYEDMDLILVMITLILMLAFYFIPVIFYNPYDAVRSVKTVYRLFYFPCQWVTELFGADLKPAAAAGCGCVLAVQLFVYKLAYSAYKKEHPSIFLKRPADEYDADDDDGDHADDFGDEADKSDNEI